MINELEAAVTKFLSCGGSVDDAMKAMQRSITKYCSDGAVSQGKEINDIIDECRREIREVE